LYFVRREEKFEADPTETVSGIQSYWCWLENQLLEVHHLGLAQKRFYFFYKKISSPSLFDPYYRSEGVLLIKSHLQSFQFLNLS
jgi:hypothetical protein